MTNDESKNRRDSEDRSTQLRLLCESALELVDHANEADDWTWMDAKEWIPKLTSACLELLAEVERLSPIAHACVDDIMQRNSKIADLEAKLADMSAAKDAVVDELNKHCEFHTINGGEAVAVNRLEAENARLREQMAPVANFMRLWNWLMRPGTGSREIILEHLIIAKEGGLDFANAVAELKQALASGAKGE